MTPTPARVALTLSLGGGSYPDGFHVGFNLADEADVHTTLARLRDAGVPIVRELGLIGGALTFQCLAPGEILVEVAHRRPAAGARRPSNGLP